MKVTDYQNDINNKIFHLAMSKLSIRFPVAEIDRKTATGKGNISAFIHNKKPISDNFINKFLGAYDLNLEDLKIELANQEKRSITPKNGLTFTEMGNGQFTVAVPLIPFEAHAQYICEQWEADFAHDYEEVTFIVDKVGFGNYRAFKIKGDSMDGGKILDTQDNAIVLARELQKHHWNDGFRACDYGWILVTNHNILFKDIIDLNKETGEITCHSRNPSPEYSDFELPLNEIHQIFKVIKRTF